MSIDARLLVKYEHDEELKLCTLHCQVGNCQWSATYSLDHDPKDAARTFALHLRRVHEFGR